MSDAGVEGVVAVVKSYRFAGVVSIVSAVIASFSFACGVHRNNGNNGASDAQPDITIVAAPSTEPTPSIAPSPVLSSEPILDASMIEDGASDASDAVEADHADGSDADGTASCPSDMVLASGNYCPELRHNCLQWMDPPGPYENFRCAEYGTPTCTSEKKTALRFCIDRDEFTPPGESLPAAHHSWTTAKSTCESMGKRLCLESEWQFACEGEEMRPYPYGFKRDATACNIDRSNLGKPNAGLRDLREPAGSHPKCVSPFGVRDMSGNVEEWATLDHPIDPSDKSTMKGAWWLPGRNTCRAATTGHGESYEGAQVGVRCCRDAKP